MLQLLCYTPKPATRRSWDFRGKDGFYIGPALHHYRCFHLLKADTGHTMFSDTIEFQHNFLTTATPPSTDDWLLHALHTLTATLSDAPHSSSNHQLTAIADLKDLFQQWRHKALLPQLETTILPMPLPRPRAPSPAAHDPTPRELTPAPTAQPAMPPPRVHTTPASNPAPWITVPTQRHTLQFSDPAPIAQRTQSHMQANHYPALANNASLLPSPAVPPGPTTLHAGSIRFSMPQLYPQAAIDAWSELALIAIAAPVLNHDTGDTLGHRQLRRNPKYNDVWNTSYSNELGRLCHGVG
jgi:hypothetical protein